MAGSIIEPVIIAMQHQALPIYSSKIEQLIDTLVDTHLCVMPGFFEPALTQALYEEVKQRSEGAQLDAARVGKAHQLSRIESIRGDAIQWLNGETAAQAQFLAIMEHYRQALNQHLFLGLNELEAHFAHYPPGTGYQRHLDSFQNNNLRRITIVVYLNPEWNEADGGQCHAHSGTFVVNVSVSNSSSSAVRSGPSTRQVLSPMRDGISMAGAEMSLRP